MSAENIPTLPLENDHNVMLKRYLKEITGLKEALAEEEKKREETCRVIEEVRGMLSDYYNKADLLQYGNLSRSSVISFLTGDVSRGEGVVKTLKKAITSLEEVNSF